MLVSLHWFEKPDIANIVGFVDCDLTYSLLLRPTNQWRIPYRLLRDDVNNVKCVPEDFQDGYA